MKIQLAQAADAAAICLVQRRSWQHVYDHQLIENMLQALPVSLHQRLWMQRIASTDCSTWTVNTPLVSGLLMLEQVDQELELAALYLDPDAIGQGWGRLLFEHACHEVNSKALYCWVMEDNHHAQGFYQHLGFEFSDERREFNFCGSHFIQKKAQLVR
ncbi:GNAT family N-acetyltransferase [Agarivorans sp. Z349TD_8]|uniref:GNAT family N-acetyltransferase n=1 Tax=Agarivorans sp. Z349TD_8 TaxID=3421434 RepID=UPI003D7D9861